jgi:hypothetical protein
MGFLGCVVLGLQLLPLPVLRDSRVLAVLLTAPPSLGFAGGVFSEAASGRIRITGPMPLGVDDGPAKLDASTGPFGRILIAIFWWMDDLGAGGLRYREW